MINDNEINFIENNFKIRICDKYCGASYELCKCNRPKSVHKSFPDDGANWSFERNTILTNCDTFGRIYFTGSENIPLNDNEQHSIDILHHRPKFIRFDHINQELIYECVYKLLCHYWHVPTPKLIISINGGLKRMNFKTNQIKKNFKQGLIDVINKDDTWIIGGGFNVGVHKLVGEAVHEYRLHQEHNKNKVTLISISAWGVVYNNQALLPKPSQITAVNRRKYKYDNTISTIKGKVALDPHYDCFLFCDDGTEGQYDKEVDFRTNLQNYIVKSDDAFIVQILFEGGQRALTNAHDTLKNKVNIVVIKGSGRAANMISTVLELSNRKFQDNINSIIEDYKDSMSIKENQITNIKEKLTDMYFNYRKQIIIHDMYDTNMKLNKSILEAIISGRDESSLEKTLQLTIRFDCPTIADKMVFLSSSYPTISSSCINEMFLDVLSNNKFEFVRLFLQNGFEIENVISRSVLANLYREANDLEQSQCFELLYDMLNDKNTWMKSRETYHGDDDRDLQAIGAIIPSISGNILKPLYTGRQSSTKNMSPSRGNDVELNFPLDGSLKNKIPTVTIQDMLLWALLSGHIELAEIFWEIGKDHVGSALIAATILKNMAFLTVKRGDIDLEKKLTNASDKFQDLATNIVSEAYNRNKLKTYRILVRSLKKWNDITCIQIAISGNLLDFLNNSACGSYAMKVWMGNMSPFLSYWKILVNIPFAVLFIKPMIIPYLNDEDERSTENVHSSREDRLGLSIENPLAMPVQRPQRKMPVTYYKAIQTFYHAPIVKFTINLISYITFLVIFSYMNLCELKYEFTSIRERWAETFVCIYVLSLFIEEIRQVVDQERTGNIVYKFIAYLSGSWNIYDIILIILFIISIIVRYVIDKSIFIISRCLFSVTLSMFCLRIMQFYFVNKSIGPKVIMIRDMIRDILFFLSIFAIFILSYGTLAHSLMKPNSEVNIFLIKDIVYLPYFQTYGEVMLDKFENASCSTVQCMIEKSTVMIGFGIFLLLTNVLLINLLIAMFGYTFNQIQGNSRKHWSFVKIQLVEEFYEKPILPPPFNLIYYIYKQCLIGINKSCRKCKPSSNNLLRQELSADENFKISGYEQFCMETIMSETNTLRAASNSDMDSMIQQLNDILEKVVPTPDANVGMKKPQFDRSSSIQKRHTRRLEIFYEEPK